MRKIIDARREPPEEGRFASLLSREAAVAGGAGGLCGIAILTAVNSAASFLGADWNLPLSLGITQIVDGVAAVTTDGLTSRAALGLWGTALTIDAALISLFAFLGWKAREGEVWAFVSGMQLYGLDTAIFVLAKDWLGVGAHALVLIVIYRGFDALRERST